MYQFLICVTKLPEQIPKGLVFHFAGEGRDDAGYLDVSVCELKHPPPQLCPMPEGLSSQQVSSTLKMASFSSSAAYLESSIQLLGQWSPTRR